LLIRERNGPAIPLHPVPLDRPAFREDTLQALLADHPQVLPVAEIEPAFAPLVCLGREIPTPSGSLDVLYVTPLGYLTLVEAKLWDNPQARREVVGQIVEYAKDFARWNFEDLDAAVRRAGGPGAEGVLETVRRYDPDFDAQAFIDTITRSLRRGSFLLLVVGNGIREGVETLTAYLQQTPSLHFSLALVELALYRTEPGQEWPLLVQPRTVARTSEVVRAVVEVRAPAELQVSVALPAEEDASRAGGKVSLTEGAFFEKLAAATSREQAAGVERLVKALRELGVAPQWRVTGVSMRLPDPGGLGREWTVLFLGADGTFWLGFLNYISQYGRYDPEIWRRYLADVKRLTGVGSSSRQQDATRAGPVSDLLRHESEFLARVERFIEDLRFAAPPEASSISDPSPD